MSQPYQVVQAYDRTLIKEIPADDAAALEAKVDAAFRLIKNRDGALKPYHRSAILIRAAALLGERLDTFARLIAQEGGKPLTDARIEAIRAVDGLRNAAEEIRNFAGREIPMGLTPASDGRWAFTTREPIGVVAAISAFNHPLNLIVHQVAPAVAVGCPVIVKPAAPTPLSCLELAALLCEAGLPEPWCQTLVTEDNALSERLATDPRIAFLSFIGSARVGWYLRSKLAPGTRCALEHGGAAPVMVDRSARLDRIIEPIVKGGYYHAGQVCVSTQRIFVHNDIKAEFVERLASRVRALRVGDPLLADTEVGPLILPREATRVSNWIDEAVAAGAQLIGGRRRSETTLEPAILVEPAADAKVSQLEIFGPVTCVYGFEKLDDAIEIANSLPFAFQASVFSTDIEPALRAAQRLDASAVMVNDHTAFRTDWMPFAGRRQSGYGIGGIRPTMNEMSEEKMIVFRQAD
ncbi:aldehyde dehydrogenase family protein [Alloacidobacterium dinghuense]|uniref:Aldehyde dehydrogenase family protein n=1 Tax=Alloacidobacterium dinghuense TaxID=2763107 RepID=A0A7G8BN40_9BACT|nr:aldehyde dehydrogenase family protein [Alloacidobacterium dinghuense]QNI33960.1 aldehyde dehydrogenase family protein [Alloacidobacterium dinghuense]